MYHWLLIIKPVGESVFNWTSRLMSCKQFVFSRLNKALLILYCVYNNGLDDKTREKKTKGAGKNILKHFFSLLYDGISWLSVINNSPSTTQLSLLCQSTLWIVSPISLLMLQLSTSRAHTAICHLSRASILQ